MMSSATHPRQKLALIALSMLLGLVTGCSQDEGIRLDDIPHYPNAIQGESMEQSAPGGFMSGALVQMSTTDSHDEVLSFYNNALSQYDSEVVTHEIAGDRQTAISIPFENGIISVAIQEYSAEQAVNITLMRVGS